MYMLTSMGAMLCDFVVVRTYAPASQKPLIMMTMRKQVHGFYRYGALHGGLWPPSSAISLLYPHINSLYNDLIYLHADNGSFNCKLQVKIT